MCRKLFLLTSFVLLLGLSGSASAIGYPGDVNDYLFDFESYADSTALRNVWDTVAGIGGVTQYGRGLETGDVYGQSMRMTAIQNTNTDGFGMKVTRKTNDSVNPHLNWTGKTGIRMWIRGTVVPGSGGDISYDNLMYRIWFQEGNAAGTGTSDQWRLDVPDGTVSTHGNIPINDPNYGVADPSVGGYVFLPWSLFSNVGGGNDGGNGTLDLESIVRLRVETYIDYAWTSATRVNGEDQYWMYVDNIQAVPDPFYWPAEASNPSPPDNAPAASVQSILSWTAGYYADTHTVYFSSSFNDVNDGTAVVSVNQPGTSYDPCDPGVLASNTTYYWRVDEVNDACDPYVWTGNVWNFTTRPAYIVREPYLQNTTQSTVDVMWGSSAASGMLYWGSSSGSYPNSVSSTAFADVDGDFVHTATITGLTAGQKVYYYVNSGPNTVGQNDSSYYAIAAPPNDASFRFAAYGDSRPAYSSNPDLAPHARVVNTMISHEPDIVLHMGDIAREGYVYEFTDFYFTPTAPLAKNTPVFTTVGNHELYEDPTGQNYRDLFGLPVNSADGTEEYYSFDYGMVHFVCLNTEFLPGGVSGYIDPTRAAEMESWLINDLNDTTQPWTVVFFHRHYYQNNVDNAWRSIFEDYGVELALAGHLHHYDSHYRNGVTYVITGGGGSPLSGVNLAMWPEYRLDSFKDYHFVQVDVTPTILYLKAYDDYNNLRKELIVVPNPPPPDMDGDGDTDLGDFAILASAWMSSPGDDNWDPAANISIISYPLDNVIDPLDMAALADNWLAGVP